MSGEPEFIPATEQPFSEKSETVEEGRAPEASDPPQETEAQEAEQAEAVEASTEESTEATNEQTENVEEDDFEEFEWNGQTIKGPKGLKEGVMKNADYTQKTQEVADRRRELEAFEQSLRSRAESADAEMEIRAKVWAEDAQLKQYENIDWRAWSEQDPVAAQQARMQFDDLVRQHGESRKELEEFATKRSQDEQQDFARRVGETRDFAQKNIQGFNDEVEKKVVDFALETGITPQQLQANLSPVIFDILHKAMLGAQVLKQPASAPRRATPLKTVSSRSNAPVRKEMGDMNMEEYVKAREAQGYKSPF